jgi:hypothetical protein
MTTNPEETFHIGVYQNLFREVELKTSNYELDDGIIDCSNTNWDNVMLNNRHYTPLDLLQIFAKYLENNNGPKHLIDECNSYMMIDHTDYEIN